MSKPNIRLYTHARLDAEALIGGRQWLRERFNLTRRQARLLMQGCRSRWQLNRETSYAIPENMPGVAQRIRQFGIAEWAESPKIFVASLEVQSPPRAVETETVSFSRLIVGGTVLLVGYSYLANELIILKD